MYLFQDRLDAGSELAQLLIAADIKNPLMLALPRGGVPVASVISHEMGIPFDVLVTRPIIYPGRQHFDIGAMAEDEKVILTGDVNYADPRIRDVINEEKHELHRRISLYREGHELPEVRDRNVVLVDDGLAQGTEALVAAKFLKKMGANMVYLAVPVCMDRADHLLKTYIDVIVCPHREKSFHSVGEWYQDFSEVSDREVLELLGKTAEPPATMWSI